MHAKIFLETYTVQRVSVSQLNIFPCYRFHLTDEVLTRYHVSR